MEEILDKMQQADVIVVATPTYFYSMNGKLKTVIDRFLPRWQNLGGHDVYLIITGHDRKEGLKLVEEELSTIFTGLGNQVKGCIWGEGVWQKVKWKTQRLWTRPIRPAVTYNLDKEETKWNTQNLGTQI